MKVDRGYEFWCMCTVMFVLKPVLHKLRKVDSHLEHISLTATIPLLTPSPPNAQYHLPIPTPGHNLEFLPSTASFMRCVFLVAIFE